MTLNAGEFFGKALKPYLQQIVDASKPLQPIIDTIFTPMPVISDLSKAAGGDEVTIATLAEKFNTLPGGPKIKPFLDAIKTVKQLLARRQVRRRRQTCGVQHRQLQPARTSDGDDERQRRQRLDAHRPDARRTPRPRSRSMPRTPPASWPPRQGASRSSTLTAGISIPVIEDPTMLFGLISGGDIPLVEFDSGPLEPGLPVPEVVRADLRPTAGDDGHRWRRLGDTPDRGGLRHLRHPPGDRDQVTARRCSTACTSRRSTRTASPIPVVKFTGYLEAGASISLGILEVGVVGGIKLTVGFYWNDPEQRRQVPAVRVRRRGRATTRSACSTSGESSLSTSRCSS